MELRRRNHLNPSWKVVEQQRSDLTTKVTCSLCGSTITDWARHESTKKHQDNIQAKLREETQRERNGECEDECEDEGVDEGLDEGENQFIQDIQDGGEADEVFNIEWAYNATYQGDQVWKKPLNEPDRHEPFNVPGTLSILYYYSLVEKVVNCNHIGQLKMGEEQIP